MIDHEATTLAESMESSRKPSVAGINKDDVIKSTDSIKKEERVLSPEKEISDEVRKSPTSIGKAISAGKMSPSQFETVSSPVDEAAKDEVEDLKAKREQFTIDRSQKSHTRRTIANNI